MVCDSVSLHYIFDISRSAKGLRIYKSKAMIEADRLHVPLAGILLVYTRRAAA